MQTLYTIESTEEIFEPPQAVKLLEKNLDQSRQLFIYLIYFITQVARYAETDARQRSSRHLPSPEDLHVNIKIAGNELLLKILEDPSFLKAINELKPWQWESTDLVRKTYSQLAETALYKEYISIPQRNRKSERTILEFIFTDLMLPNEDFVSHIEEFFIHWDDDSEMMNQLMMNFLQKPGTYNLQEMVSPEKRKFAHELLDAVMEKKNYAWNLIKPKLKNWDPDRIALLDMILMQMGVCEFLYFETIPTKVTINEYIDLAKEYSTPQSGQFVNGILDNIHKDLLAQDKLHKISYKKP